jgi:hypothetical protein
MMINKKLRIWYDNQDNALYRVIGRSAGAIFLAPAAKQTGKIRIPLKNGS